MTLKTTKTLFFIPIIGMMILPFGMMDTADAVSYIKLKK